LHWHRKIHVRNIFRSIDHKRGSLSLFSFSSRRSIDHKSQNRSITIDHKIVRGGVVCPLTHLNTQVLQRLYCTSSVRK
jgi:hypothetical protein